MSKFDLNLGYNDVVCHPYRTARVEGARITIDRMSPDHRDLEEDLAKAAGVRTDNHVVYSVVPKNGDPALHFWITDSHILIGTKLIEGSW